MRETQVIRSNGEKKENDTRSFVKCLKYWQLFSHAQTVYTWLKFCVFTKLIFLDFKGLKSQEITFR